MPGSYFTLKALAGPKDKDPGGAFRRMAQGLEGTEEKGNFRVRILEDDDSGKERQWTLKMSGGRCEVGSAGKTKADFEVITDAGTWQEIAEGSLAPLRAFTQGRMRLLGDVQFGTRVLKTFASPEVTSTKGDKTDAD